MAEASGWSIVTSPNVTYAEKNNFLKAVTCSSAADCWSVGYSQAIELSAIPAQTLIEHWDGNSWRIVPSPNTSDTESNSLAGVTCVTASDCWAIGSYMTGGGLSQTLIERWDGTSWNIITSPNTSATQSNSLTGVTCASVSDCWGVGSYLNGGSSQTLIEHWDGSSWSLVVSPNTSATQSNSLAGVACVSNSDCWAVGSYIAGSTAETLVEHWDGASWEIVVSPNIVPPQYNFLTAVTCTSTSNCWAVGYYIAGSNVQSLIEQWDGTSWSIVPSPNIPGGETTSSLYGITCTSASDCWAGGLSRGGGPFQTLVEHWDGTLWTIISSPNTAAQDNFLYSVTCATASECWAVGPSNTGNISRTLVENWNGSSWAVVTSPNSTATQTTNVLSSTTCVSDSACWAVGYSWNGTVYRTLIEYWDGTSWSIVPAPNVSATQSNSLAGVACASPNDCWAVGVYSSAGAAGSTGQTLIEHWNGTSWSIVPSPNTLPTQSNSLAAVSCISSTDCWAVGSYALGNIGQTLTEHWDGTSWSIVSSPSTNPAQPNSLAAVTCASTSDCWTAGWYQTGSVFQTLIEKWDGASWSIVASPNTSTTKANLLRGVTCVSSSDCWAAGYAVSGSVYQTLIERWDGSAWTIAPTANSSVAENNLLYALTCASASNCWSVGVYQTGGMYQTLIERWDATSWSLDSSPNVNATAANLLYGVACTSASNCWAVGYFHTGTVYQTLVMHYPAPVALVSAASRKTHDSAGTFDVDLPLTGPRGIECRSGGADGNYTIVFTFTNPLTSVGGASVTSGTGSVSSKAIDTSDAHQYIVNLTGVTNAQTITMALTNVNDSAGNRANTLSAAMAVLIGDTSGNGLVNSTDVSQTQAQSGQAVTGSNFRTDVNANGLINSTDVSLVQSKSGTGLP